MFNYNNNNEKKVLKFCEKVYNENNQLKDALNQVANERNLLKNIVDAFAQEYSHSQSDPNSFANNETDESYDDDETDRYENDDGFKQFLANYSPKPKPNSKPKPSLPLNIGVKEIYEKSKNHPQFYVISYMSHCGHCHKLFERLGFKNVEGDNGFKVPENNTILPPNVLAIEAEDLSRDAQKQMGITGFPDVRYFEYGNEIRYPENNPNKKYHIKYSDYLNGYKNNSDNQFKDLREQFVEWFQNNGYGDNRGRNKISNANNRFNTYYNDNNDEDDETDYIEDDNDGYLPYYPSYADANPYGNRRF